MSFGIKSGTLDIFLDPRLKNQRLGSARKKLLNIKNLM